MSQLIRSILVVSVLIVGTTPIARADEKDGVKRTGTLTGVLLDRTPGKGVTVKGDGEETPRRYWRFGDRKDVSKAIDAVPIGSRVLLTWETPDANEGPHVAKIEILRTPAAPAGGADKGLEVKAFTFKKTKQADLQIHVHYPADWKKGDKRPGIVFWFGGGFKNGTVETFRPQASYFASRGMVAARADYRVKDRHGVEPDVCVADGKSALRWFRQHAAELGVDPERIVASGGSAGGYIAACCACPGDDPDGEDLAISSKPNALVLFNPFFPFQGKEANWKTIPLRHVAKDFPPMLMMFGTEDGLLRPAEQMAAKSKEVGHRAEMFLAPGVGHGFFNAPPWREKTTQRADEFLATLGYVEGPPTIKIPEGKSGAPFKGKPAAPFKGKQPQPTQQGVRYGPHERNILDVCYLLRYSIRNAAALGRRGFG